MGLLGFSFLLFNQTVGLLDPNSDAGRVRATDMAFAGSSFLFALIAFVQTVVYPSDASMRSTRIAVSLVFGFYAFAAFL